MCRSSQTFGREKRKNPSPLEWSFECLKYVFEKETWHSSSLHLQDDLGLIGGTAEVVEDEEEVAELADISWFIPI
jgi:hypothetical protein